VRVAAFTFSDKVALVFVAGFRTKRPVTALRPSRTVALFPEPLREFVDDLAIGLI
jgi:hypothetical protein